MKFIHIALLVSCCSFISASNKTNTLLVGDWKLIEFKIPKNSEWDVNVWGPVEVTYSFTEQGTYEFRFDSTYLQKGKWKASDNMLHLKNIINVVDSSLVNYETIFFYGTSSQKKQIIKLEQNDFILATALPIKGHEVVFGTAYFKRQY